METANIQPLVRFEGKVALVAGGSGGVGSAAVRRIAAEGGAVAVHYSTNSGAAEELVAGIRAAKGSAIALQADLSEPEAPDWLVAETVREFGGLDSFISTIGTTDKLYRFLEMSDEVIDRTISVELRSTMRCTRAVLPHLVERGSGHIVFVGSDSGKVGALGEAASAACRGGIISFAKAIAREFARSGVTINVVCPGPVDTEAFRRVTAEADLTGKILGSILRSVPMNRAATAMEVANVAVFLASSEASFVTGQAISVSGGMTLC